MTDEPIALEQIAEKLDSAADKSHLPGVWLVEGEHSNHRWDGSGPGPGNHPSTSIPVGAYNSNTHPRGPVAERVPQGDPGPRPNPNQGVHVNVNTAGVVPLINPQAGGSEPGMTSNTSPVDPNPIVPLGELIDPSIRNVVTK